MYDAAIGRFPSVDPIADQFAHVSPFNYAENRVPNGIDLWGLQYLNSNVAKIYIHGGGTSLKYNNLSNWTKGKIKGAQSFIEYYSDGTHGYSSTFPQAIDDLNFEPSQLKRANTPLRPIGHVLQGGTRSRPGGGNSRQRRKWRRQMARLNTIRGQSSPGQIASGTSSSGRANLIIWVLIESVKFVENNRIENDLETAEAQSNNYGDMIQGMIMDALENNVIDVELQTAGRLGDIGNYILQGEFTGDYDEETRSKMEETAKKIITDNGVPNRTNNP
jgi:hypothetical protein